MWWGEGAANPSRMLWESLIENTVFEQTSEGAEKARVSVWQGSPSRATANAEVLSTSVFGVGETPRRPVRLELSE